MFYKKRIEELEYLVKNISERHDNLYRAFLSRTSELEKDSRELTDTIWAYAKPSVHQKFYPFRELFAIAHQILNHLGLEVHEVSVPDPRYNTEQEKTVKVIRLRKKLLPSPTKPLPHRKKSIKAVSTPAGERGLTNNL
jgi:hypothetical protein